MRDEVRSAWSEGKCSHWLLAFGCWLVVVALSLLGSGPLGKRIVMRDFKKLEVWQLGMEIADQVFEIFDTIPWQQAGNKIRDQATDAACSIPSNIAEGSSRRSEKEKYRYYEFALGSSFELQTRMLVIQRRKYADSEVIERLLQKIELEQKKIGAFMNALDA